MTSKKELIIEAASRRFERYGYTKTSLEEIAHDLGIGKATIYHYFGSKEDLLLNVIQMEAARLREKTLEALKKVATPPEKLRLFLQIHFDHIFQSANIKSLNRETIYKLQPIVDNAVREFYQDQLKMLRSILEEGIAGKFFRPLDVDALANLLLSVLRSFFTPKLLLDQTISPKRLLDAFLDIILQGIQVAEVKNL